MSYPAHSRPTPTAPTLPPDQVAQILSYLDLPPSSADPAALPSASATFLKENYSKLPSAYLPWFGGEITTPRERTPIREVKARRYAWATSTSTSKTPSDGVNGNIGELARSRGRRKELTAEEGWRRWPLLWEGLGGDPRGPPNVPARGFNDRNQADFVGRGQPYGARSDQVQGAFQPGVSDGNGTEKLSDDQLERLAVQLSNPNSRTTPQNILTSTFSTSRPSSSSNSVPAQPSNSTLPQGTSSRTTDELSFSPFPSLPRTSLHINKLPNLLAEYEGEREDEELRERRRGERRWMMERAARGEEFEDSDEEEEGEGEQVGGRNVSGAGVGRRTENSRLGEPDSLAVPLPLEEQASLIPIFERRILELFLDGLDPSLPYDKIDFGLAVQDEDGEGGENSGVGGGGDRLLDRDREERYFDDEEEGEQAERGENGLAEGEYDY